MAFTLSLLLTLNSTLASGPITVGKDVTYKIDGTEFEGYSATPSSSKGITVYVIQDWNGVDKHEKGVCDKLAAAGYDAFAIDVYGRDSPPITHRLFCRSRKVLRQSNPLYESAHRRHEICDKKS